MMTLSKLKIGLAILVSTGLVAVGSGMLGAQVPAEKAAAKSGEKTTVEVNLEALGQARIKMAKKRFETQVKFYREGRLTVDRLLNASETLMNAELDTTESPEARLNSIKAHVDRIKEMEKRESAEFAIGRATTADIEELQTHRLESEFRIAKESEKPVSRSSVADLERRLSEVEKKVDRLLNVIDQSKNEPKRK